MLGKEEEIQDFPGFVVQETEHLPQSYLYDKWVKSRAFSEHSPNLNSDPVVHIVTLCCLTSWFLVHDLEEIELSYSLW